MQCHQKLSTLSLLEKNIETNEMQMRIIRAYYHLFEKKLQVFAFQCSEQLNTHFKNNLFQDAAIGYSISSQFQDDNSRYVGLTAGCCHPPANALNKSATAVRWARSASMRVSSASR